VRSASALPSHAACRNEKGCAAGPCYVLTLASRNPDAIGGRYKVRSGSGVGGTHVMLQCAAAAAAARAQQRLVGSPRHALQIKMKDGKGEQSFALVNVPFL
jgi:hypothetical protein